VEWSPRYELGVPLIDAQHRQLFETAGALIEQVSAGRTEAVAPTLAFLRKYALEHFAAEQALMVASGYPDADPHAAEHARFAEEVGALVTRHAREPRSPWLASNLAVVVADWLRSHVLGADAALGRHLRERGPGAGEG
jgi:hemerythrin